MSVLLARIVCAAYCGECELVHTSRAHTAGLVALPSHIYIVNLLEFYVFVIILNIFVMKLKFYPVLFWARDSRRLSYVLSSIVLF